MWYGMVWYVALLQHLYVRMANRLRTKSLNWQQSNPHLYYSEPVLLGFSLNTLHHADPVVYFVFCQCWSSSVGNTVLQTIWLKKTKTKHYSVLSFSWVQMPAWEQVGHVLCVLIIHWKMLMNRILKLNCKTNKPIFLTLILVIFDLPAGIHTHLHSRRV